MVAVAAGLLLLAGTARAQQQPISGLAEAASSGFLRGFTKACVDAMGASNYGKLYCPCVAAFISDRFTIDEASDSQMMSSAESMEKVHPGITNLMKVCAMAAKPTN